MAGHSHWAGIKHKKAALDAKRGKLWSKLARLIIVAAKAGGGDPSQNLSLRYAIDKSKAANMPKDTIEKAIKKGTGDLEGVSFEEVAYEGYACNGVAVLCEGLTDNRNRTAPEMRKIFDVKGGSLGSTGCVAWIFTPKGMFTVPTDSIDEDSLMEVALDAGAEDIENDGENFVITCDPLAFNDVKTALDAKEINTTSAELTRIPSTTVKIDNVKSAKKILTLMEMLDDHEDIQQVHSNFDIPEEILKQIDEE